MNAEVALRKLEAAIGRPIEEWARNNGLSVDETVKAVRRYLEGSRLRAYWAQIAVRLLFKDLGVPIDPLQELPRSEALMTLAEERIKRREAA